MKPTASAPLRLFAAAAPFSRRQCLAAAAAAGRAISTTPLKPAEVAPVLGTGPPPQPPVADPLAADRAAEARARVERRRKQAEMLKQAKNIRGAADAKAGKTAGLKRRFWNDVSVQEVDGECFL